MRRSPRRHLPEGRSAIGVLKHITGYERPPERVVLTNYATDAMSVHCRALGAMEVFDQFTEIEKLVDWLASGTRHLGSPGAMGARTPAFARLCRRLVERSNRLGAGAR